MEVHEHECTIRVYPRDTSVIYRRTFTWLASSVTVAVVMLYQLLKISPTLVYSCIHVVHNMYMYVCVCVCVLAIFLSCVCGFTCACVIVYISEGGGCYF